MAVPLVNFSKGEIAEELQARFDVQAYSAAAKRARNVRVKKYGGLEKRPGTRFVAEVYDPTEPVRLIPFQFSFSQAYALELGQGYMRVAALGGMVLNPELAVTDISDDAEAVVEAAFHGYAEGDQVFFTDQDGDFAILNGRFWTVTDVPDADHFAIDFDATGLTFTGSSGGATNAGAPPPPPPPPPVPDPVDPPAPPDVGGGGHCVTGDTLILMADGSESPASDIRVGDWVHTQRDDTLEWGNYPVIIARTVSRPVWFIEIGGKTLRASTGHPIWHDGGWMKIEDIGVPDGLADVVLLTIGDAHTYVSNGILSHNKDARGE